MEHHANIHHPNTSPMWSNTCTMSSSMTSPTYDGYKFWYWNPSNIYKIWFDTPIDEEDLGDGNVCYRLQGNVWLCANVTEEQLPPVIVPMPNPMANLKPMISVTSVKMENHPDHVSVMFGQIMNNLK